MRWVACRAGWAMFAHADGRRRRHQQRRRWPALTRAVGLLPLVLGTAPSLPGLCCAASMLG